MTTSIEREERKSTCVKGGQAEKDLHHLGRLFAISRPEDVASGPSWRLPRNFGSVTQLRTLHVIVWIYRRETLGGYSHLYVNDNAEKRQKKESRQIELFCCCTW